MMQISYLPDCTMPSLRRYEIFIALKPLDFVYIICITWHV